MLQDKWQSNKDCEMKKIKIRDLPNNMYFWRSNDGVRWLKTSEHTMRQTSSTDLPDSIADYDEVVLSDPIWCSNCWEEIPWPPTSSCPSCGMNNTQGLSIEDLEEEVKRWTGSSYVII